MRLGGVPVCQLILHTHLRHPACAPNLQDQPPQQQQQQQQQQQDDDDAHMVATGSEGGEDQQQQNQSPRVSLETLLNDVHLQPVEAAEGGGKLNDVHGPRTPGVPGAWGALPKWCSALPKLQASTSAISNHHVIHAAMQEGWLRAILARRQHRRSEQTLVRAPSVPCLGR